MTGEKFTEIVTKRAHERVNEKLRIFKGAICRAFNDLTGTSYVCRKANFKSESDRHANYLILTLLHEKADLEPKGLWPKYLWTKEEELVKEELLALMDEMQKALISPGPAKDDCVSA